MKTSLMTVALALAPLVAAAQAQPAENPFAPPGLKAATPELPAPGSITPPPPSPVKIEEPVVEERVRVTRIGTINGQHIFKGNGGATTYLFESKKDVKIARKPVTAAMEAQPEAMPSVAGASPSDRPNLPSMVGTRTPPPSSAGRSAPVAPPKPAPAKPAASK